MRQARNHQHLGMNVDSIELWWSSVVVVVVQVENHSTEDTVKQIDKPTNYIQTTPSIAGLEMT